MKKGRRKIVKGMVLALIGIFVLTQPIWAATFTGTEITIPESYNSLTNEDKILFLNKLNRDGLLSAENLETLVATLTVTVEEEDFITISVVSLFGKIINNAFVVTRQLVDFITTDFIGNTRTIGQQVTTFILNARGQVVDARGGGSSTTVDGKGIVGDREINVEAARVVTTSQTRQEYVVFFGSPLVSGVRQSSTSTDKENMRESRTLQIIAYVIVDGRYVSGSGEILGNSNNLNFKVVRNADGTLVETEEIVRGNEILTTTRGVLQGTRASAVNAIVFNNSEIISVTNDRLANEITVTSQKSREEVDAFGNTILSDDGTPSADAKTYSLTISSREGRVDFLAMLEAGEGEDLLAGTTRLREIFKAEDSAKDGLVKTLTGDRVEFYTSSEVLVRFGLQSRTGANLATETVQTTIQRDIIEGNRTQIDNSTTITTTYTADLSGRIKDQIGVGTGREAHLRADGTINEDDFSAFSNTTLTFVINTDDNVALISESKTERGERDYVNNTQALSTQVSTFTYVDGALDSATAVSRQSRTHLVEVLLLDANGDPVLDADGNPVTLKDEFGNTILVGDPNLGTHSESFSVVEFDIVGNAARQKVVRTITITDTHSDSETADDQGNRAVNRSELVYNYALGVAVGRLVNVNTPGYESKSSPMVDGQPELNGALLISTYELPKEDLNGDGIFDLGGGFGLTAPDLPVLPSAGTWFSQP